LLVAGTDYTATTLTSVTLTSGAAASDIVEIVAYDIFSVADTVSSANGGTFDGAVTFDGTATFNGSVVGIDTDKIEEGNSSVEVVDTGTGYVAVTVDGSETARFDDNGHLGIGNTDPSAGQLVLTKSSDGGFGGSLVLENSNGSDTDKVIIAMRPNGSATTAVGSYGENRIISEYDSGSTNGASNIQFWTHAGVGSVAERVRIDSSGRFIVGSTTAVTTNVAGVMLSKVGTQGRIEIGCTSTTGQDLAYFFNPNGIVGSIQTSGSSTSYNTSSDYRLKEDWVPMSDSIARVKALNPVNFAWKVDGTRVDGFLAHEAQEVVPEAVTGTKDAVDKEGKPEYQGIDQSKLVPLLTAALQETIKQVEELKAEVAALKGA